MVTATWLTGILVSSTLFTAVISADEPSQPTAPFPTVLMGYLDFPPLMWDENGTPTGSLIDLTKDIAKDQNLTIEFVYRPVKRLYTDLARGDIHLWIGSPDTTEIKDKVIFRDPPLVVAKLQLYSRTGRTIPAFSDLENTSLIIINGYRYGGLWEQLNDPSRALSLLPAMNHQTALNMLSAGRADYVLDYARPTNKLTPQLIDGEFNQRLVQAFPSYYNVSKKAPHAQELLDRLHAGLKKIRYATQAAE